MISNEEQLKVTQIVSKRKEKVFRAKKSILDGGRGRSLKRNVD